MAKKYVLDGYTTPAGITDAAGVKKMQQELGVTADGVWGPQTQNAYNRYLSARMDGISDSYYPNNENNARMRDVSAPYHSQSTQYQNIRGISDPYFSNGDSFVAYTDYLNERAQRNKSAAYNEPVIETKVRNSLGGENGTQKKQEEWMKRVSSSLPGASTLGTGQNPWGGSMPYTQDPMDILAQRNAAQQAANGFGAFRLAAQKSDEEMKRRENAKKAIEAGEDAAKTNGFSAGLMPVPQYGASGNPALSSFPANSATPQEILAEVDRQRQIANSMGAFRLAAQKSDAESARRAGVKSATDSGQAVAQANGYSAGLMPVPQYGQNPAVGSAPYGVYPVSPTLPWQSPEYSSPSRGGEPVDVGDAVDIAGFSLNQIGEEVGQSFSKAGGEVLGTIGDIIGLVNLGSIVSEDLHDDGKIGIKTGTAVSGAIGSVVGNAIGTALVMLVGAGLGIATGGLAIPAFIGGLVVSGLGEKFATDMVMTAYGRFTNPDSERVAEQMEHANYLMDDLAEYAKDNRISSSMPVPVFY
jgi:hypothetical protein